MAQIIKHRRGNITDVKALTNNNAEFIVASGSINDLVGPFVMIGSPTPADNGVAGAFKPTSKLYQGSVAPTISSVTYGSILDGTPYHATSNNTLYILNNDGAGGNQAIDLSGNIEGTTITNVNITNLNTTIITGDTANITNITGSFYGDGSNLTGLVTVLNISGDTGNESVDLLTQTLGIEGTANEIETSITSGTTAVTIGLPDEVTIQTGSIANDLTVGGDLLVSGNFTVLGGVSEVHISSSVVEINDNIIRLNAYSPYERYAGIEVLDSGSVGLSGSFLYDSVGDYWLSLNSNDEAGAIITTTTSTIGNENSLTVNTLPKATSGYGIGDSLLIDNGRTLAYNANKFTVASSNGATLIAGSVTLTSAGGLDAGTNSSAIVFKNSSNILGYVSTIETTDVLDGILGYKSSDGQLVFSTVIDGGIF